MIWELLDDPIEPYQLIVPSEQWRRRAIDLAY
jgi:hypothetical protein